MSPQVRKALLCKKCGHNMGRSRFRNGGVRCNKCKTQYTLIIKPKRA